jgi:YVTN family beta-propeller protein
VPRYTSSEILSTAKSNVFNAKGDFDMMTAQTSLIYKRLRLFYALIGAAILPTIITPMAGAQMTQTPSSKPAAKAYVANFKDNTVSVIDTATSKVVASIQVAAGPHGMAITQDGRTVYVSGDGSSSVDVIDTASDKVVKTIDVGKSPNGIALTSDDRLLLVTVNGENRIAFIDTSTQAVVGTTALPKPHTVAISPDGKFAYVTVQEPGHFGLALIDTATHRVVRTIALDKTPRDGEIGYDGKRFFFTEAGVNAVQVLDPLSDTIVAQIPTGVSPHFVSYTRGSGFGIVVVQGPGELLLFDPVTNTVARSVPVGKQPHWATASGDGKVAYVTNEGSNDVTVVDLASGRTQAIAVGNAPRKIVVQRNAPAAEIGGAKVSINNFTFTPAEVTVAPGENVTWINDDGAPHGLEYPDGVKGTDLLLPGASFSRRFDRSGTFDYVCSVHPYMTGRVVVHVQ